MNKIALVIIVIIIIVGGYFLTKSYYKPAQNPPQNPSQNPSGNTSGEVLSGQVNIAIKNFSFNPQTVTIKKGATIIWTNEDSTIHKIASDTFNSGNLNQGNTYQFQFNNTGTYNYHCAIHPSMTGQIIVVD